MGNIKKIQQALPETVDAILLFSEANQRYATGFGFTDGAVLVGRNFARLITDSRYVEAAMAECDPAAEIALIKGELRVNDWIGKLVEEQQVRSLGVEENVISYGAYSQLQEMLPCSLVPAQSVLLDLRASKSSEELDCMIRAQRIAEAALDEVLGLIHPGMTERELAAEINYQMMRRGADGNSFDTIAIFGQNTSKPHGVPGERVLEKGEFITMDFGCVKDGYCSDMTRTVAFGSATDEMRKVYDIVLEAQLTGIAAARWGKSGREIDAAAREVIKKAGYGEYFGHSFGHSLGLEIHEAPNASPLEERPMPVGAMISAEPGIYIPGHFGVRIEDVLYLGKDGTIDITHSPKELTIL